MCLQYTAFLVLYLHTQCFLHMMHLALCVNIVLILHLCFLLHAVHCISYTFSLHSNVKHIECQLYVVFFTIEASQSGHVGGDDTVRAQCTLYSAQRTLHSANMYNDEEACAQCVQQ